MDQLLSGIPKTQCIIDHIIVIGETDDEHVRNLEMVLQRLLDAGLRAHPVKTTFLVAKTALRLGVIEHADDIYLWPAILFGACAHLSAMWLQRNAPRRGV